MSTPDGVVHIVNEWQVRQQVPAVVRSILKTGELGWVDRNTWDAEAFTCAWAIEPRVPHRIYRMFGQDDVCRGDGGARNAGHFEGEFDLKPGVLGSLGSVEALLSGFLETIVTTIIPRNLRGVVEAAADSNCRGSRS